MTPADLIISNTYSSELMAHIWLAVENRKSLIIAGGTASRKTSTMDAASFFIPAVAKIVSIEDTPEIQLPHVNWLPMKTRESTSNVRCWKRQHVLTFKSLTKTGIYHPEEKKPSFSRLIYISDAAI